MNALETAFKAIEELAARQKQRDDEIERAVFSHPSMATVREIAHREMVKDGGMAGVLQVFQSLFSYEGAKTRMAKQIIAARNARIFWESARGERMSSSAMARMNAKIENCRVMAIKTRG